MTIIDDAYNSNPVGSKAAVETLAMFEGVRIPGHARYGGMGDSEEEYNYKFGTYAAGCCDYVALVGERHTRPIREGLLAEGFDETRIFTGGETGGCLAVCLWHTGTGTQIYFTGKRSAG